MTSWYRSKVREMQNQGYLSKRDIEQQLGISLPPQWVAKVRNAVIPVVSMPWSPRGAKWVHRDNLDELREVFLLPSGWIDLSTNGTSDSMYQFAYRQGIPTDRMGGRTVVPAGYQEAIDLERKRVTFMREMKNKIKMAVTKGHRSL